MRLPSLNALRAFEAAARHVSFARAANELCVSEGAVSRHIKLLEDELGVPLFRRLVRRVELTEDGRRLQPVINAAFSSIAKETTRIASPRTGLKIACDQTLSIRWLVPRLERFRARHPDIGLDLTPDYVEDDDLIEQGFDMRFGSCTIPQGFESVRVMSAAMTPACSPRLLKAGPALGTPRDLALHTLLHPTSERHDWQVWAERFCPGELVTQRGQNYSSLDMALQAAVIGEGVVLGDITLMGPELSSGALVLPFPDLVLRHEREDYYVMCRKELVGDDRVVAFRQWLIEERGRDQSGKEN